MSSGRQPRKPTPRTNSGSNRRADSRADDPRQDVPRRAERAPEVRRRRSDAPSEDARPTSRRPDATSRTVAGSGAVSRVSPSSRRDSATRADATKRTGASAGTDSTTRTQRRRDAEGAAPRKSQSDRTSSRSPQRREGAGAKDTRPSGRTRGDRGTTRASSADRGTTRASSAKAEGRPAALSRLSDIGKKVQGRGKGAGAKTDISPRGILARVGIIVVAILVVWFAWSHRPVKVTLNGEECSFSRNTRLTRIVAKSETPYEPGDYVTVSGNVITEGKGAPFDATVNDQALSVEEARAYRIQGGETIVLADGSDIIEEYDAVPTEIAPKLVEDESSGAIVYVSQWGVPGIRETRTGKESGEVATVTTREVQDCVISKINVEPADGRQIVALTFDDGPSQYTEQVLAILKEHGAVATFFELGSNIENDPEMAARVVAEGHELMSHTYSHYDLTGLGGEDLRWEISTTFDLITQAGGNTTIFRPPGGYFDMNDWLMSQGLVSAYIYWNVDTRDWTLPGSGAIWESATSATTGDIILMHDGGGDRSQDVAALPDIIDTLHEQGYEFVTITELMQSDPRIPADIASGHATMPEDAVWPTEMG